MAAEELRGRAFVNKRQRDGKSDPDWCGDCTIDGKIYYVDIWSNTSQVRGEPDFLGIRFKLKHTAANDRSAQDLFSRHGSGAPTRRDIDDNDPPGNF